MAIQLPHPNIEFPPNHDPTPADIRELTEKLQANLEALAKGK